MPLPTLKGVNNPRTVLPYEMRNADYTHIHTFNYFRYSANKLETQVKLAMGRTYEYQIPSDASIYRLMPTKALN
jgi:hypothetical protein